MSATVKELLKSEVRVSKWT